MCRGERAFFSCVFRGPYHLLCHGALLSSREVKTEAKTKTKTKRKTKTRPRPRPRQRKRPRQDKTKNKTLLHGGGYSSFFPRGLGEVEVGMSILLQHTNLGEVEIGMSILLQHTNWGEWKLGCPSCFNMPTTPLKKNLNKYV